ncbi:MAG: nucleotidyltransferase family protein [Kiritimatiellota bacterium]|nr:nucleotidyltransferase family protein [Kiritimatiellota bacterium]
MTLHGIDIPQERMAAFCRENGIRRLALFGSVLRDDFRPDCDVDVLVEFQAGVRVGYFAIARMTRELADMMGRAVDMRTPAELHPAFRDEVMREALIEYVAA